MSENKPQVRRGRTRIPAIPRRRSQHELKDSHGEVTQEGYLSQTVLASYTHLHLASAAERIETNGRLRHKLDRTAGSLGLPRLDSLLRNPSLKRVVRRGQRSRRRPGTLPNTTSSTNSPSTHRDSRSRPSSTNPARVAARIMASLSASVSSCRRCSPRISNP
jgi:hypothetical protein